jgi:hypothetical protein
LASPYPFLLARIIHDDLGQSREEGGSVVVKRDLVAPQGVERSYFGMGTVVTAYDGGKRAHLACLKRLMRGEVLFAVAKRSL